MQLTSRLKSTYTWIFVGLFVLAAVLRFTALDFQDIWIDEIYSMQNTSDEKSLRTIYKILLETDPHPPLYYMSLAVFRAIFGASIWVARFYSAIIGLAGLIAMYALAREMYNRSTACIALAFLAVNYSHVYYSQEIRMYSLLFLTATCSFWALVRYMKLPSRRRLIIYIIFSWLMINTHFFGLFTFVSQYAILTWWAFSAPDWKARLNGIRKVVIAGAITMVLYIPTLFIFINTTSIENKWIQKPGLDLTSFMLNDLFGYFEFTLWVVTLGAVLYFIRLTKTTNKDVKPALYTHHTSASVLLIWIAVSFLIPYIYTFVQVPIFVNRYMITLLAPILLIVAYGLDQLRSNVVKVVILGVVLLTSIIQLVYIKAYYTTKTKSEFTRVSEEIKKRNANNDPIVSYWGWLMPHFFKDSVILRYDINSFIDSMRTNQQYPISFWYVDGNSRPLELTAENQAYINLLYDVTDNFQYHDCYGVHYQLKEMTNQNQIVQFAQFPEFSRSNAGVIALYTNTGIYSEIIKVEAGDYTLRLKAQSLPNPPINGENAHLKIDVGNQFAADLYVSENLEGTEYSYPIKFNQAENVRIKLTFDNDLLLNDLDRNLIIQQIDLTKN